MSICANILRCRIILLLKCRQAEEASATCHGFSSNASRPFSQVIHLYLYFILRMHDLFLRPFPLPFRLPTKTILRYNVSLLNKKPFSSNTFHSFYREYRSADAEMFTTGHIPWNGRQDSRIIHTATEKCTAHYVCYIPILYINPPVEDSPPSRSTYSPSHTPYIIPA